MTNPKYTFAGYDSRPPCEASITTFVEKFPNGTSHTRYADETWYIHGFYHEIDRHGNFFPFIICSEDPMDINHKLLNLLAVNHNFKYNLEQFQADIKAWKERNL